MLSKEQIMERLKGVVYPGFEKDIVSFGFVKNVQAGELIKIDVEIVSSNPDIANELKADISRVLGGAAAEINIIQPKMPQEKSNSQSGKNIAPQIKKFRNGKLRQRRRGQKHHDAKFSHFDGKAR